MTIKLKYFTNNKAHLMWALLLVLVVNSSAQINLVPNPSFEMHSIPCSSLTNSSSNVATSWISPVINSSSSYGYVNACASNICCGVPFNTFGRGFQYAHSGSGYVAFFAVVDDGFNVNFRNYLQSKLFMTLQANKCYYIEYFINLSNAYLLGCNNVGLLVGDTGIISNKSKYVSASPQILQFGNPVIIDTMNWVKIAGIYKAHGGEQYITIGNFKDDLHTDTIFIQKAGNSGASYYLDDVSVIPLDSMQLKAEAGRDTTIVKGDSVWIGSRLCGLTNVVWYDAANNVIDTGAPGLWVKPTSNTFYVIEQDVCGQYSRDTVYVAVVPLPVSMLNFECLMFNERQVKVSWQTATEINVSHFNVQSSTNGVNFNSIGKVNAKGASKYSFIDNTNFSGVVYYRLEVVDKNGSKTYSEIRDISIGNNKEIKVFPNPTRGDVNVQLPTAGNWQIITSDIAGRVVWKEEGSAGTIKHTLKGASGVYFIKVINKRTGMQSVHKVTLQ